MFIQAQSNYSSTTTWKLYCRSILNDTIRLHYIYHKNIETSADNFDMQFNSKLEAWDVKHSEMWSMRFLWESGGMCLRDFWKIRCKFILSLVKFYYDAPVHLIVHVHLWDQWNFPFLKVNHLLLNYSGCTIKEQIAQFHLYQTPSPQYWTYTSTLRAHSPGRWKN